MHTHYTSKSYHNSFNDSFLLLAPSISFTHSTTQPHTLTHPRLLSHQIHTRILSPTLLPSLFSTVRTTLFPNNALGPARVVPLPSEHPAIKRVCALAIVDRIPAFARKIYFGSEDREDAARQTERIVLDCFEDQWINKHLVFSIVDLVVCRLFPEIERMGLEELKAGTG